MSSNLPPGVSASDIPGNRPEDEAWDRLFDWLDQTGLSPEELRRRVDTTMTDPREGLREKVDWLVQNAFDLPGGINEAVDRIHAIYAPHLRAPLTDEKRVERVAKALARVHDNKGRTKPVDGEIRLPYAKGASVEMFLPFARKLLSETEGGEK